MDVDTGGRFVNPWHEPRVPVIRGDENNELDMTFSFGRDIDGPGVDAFLLANAFRDFDEMRKVVDTMHVNPKSHKIRQVVITCCKKGQNDVLVKMLQPCVKAGAIGHCHSYSATEIPVIVDWLHSSVNIQQDFIENFLEKFHGKVLSWKARRHSGSGIKTGEYTFVMNGEDLRTRPIPRKVKFNNRFIYIRYLDQPLICFKCGKAGHKGHECPSYPELNARNYAGFSVYEKQIQAEAKANAKKAMADQTKALAELTIGANDKSSGDLVAGEESPPDSTDGSVSSQSSAATVIENNPSAAESVDGLPPAVGDPVLPVPEVDGEIVVHPPTDTTGLVGDESLTDKRKPSDENVTIDKRSYVNPEYCSTKKPRLD